MSTHPTQELSAPLREWRAGRPEALLSALGFRPRRLLVARPALTDFGLDPGTDVRLEVLARHSGFVVIRVRTPSLANAELRQIARSLYRHNPGRRALLIFEPQSTDALVFASWGLGPGPFRLRTLHVPLDDPRALELDILSALAVAPGQTAADLALAQARALDREGITRKFFSEFRRYRADLASTLTGVPIDAQTDRLEIALVILTRILFLCFVQQKGWLAGEPDYLRRLYAQALRDRTPFFRRRLKPLFFEALNRPPERRSARARQLGDLPYLNGGLFEREALERRYPRIDLPDEWFASLFDDFLDRYRFTLIEEGGSVTDVGVDPEMLGKVFEGLMAEPERDTSGTFYTPRRLVDRLVDGTLCSYLSRAAACSNERVAELLDGPSQVDLLPDLRRRLMRRVGSIRVLDPAAGSGAFLLAALQRLERLRDLLEGPPESSGQRFKRRQEIVERNLFGVDISPTAVRLCELRLWLALIVDLEVDRIENVPPLPNLDLKIRQGDALLDPIDFLMQVADLGDGALISRWRHHVGRLQDRRTRYYRAAGPQKRRSDRALRRAEKRLALDFLTELATQIDRRIADLSSVECSPDLFGTRVGLPATQRRRLASYRRRRTELQALIRRIEEVDELPFFSFPIHFADPCRPGHGFDLVVGNPPWIRIHHWTGAARQRLRERYRSLRDAGWRDGSRFGRAGPGFGSQLDLSALFLERGLEVLNAGGALGFLVPSKLARALYAGGLRSRLMRSVRLLYLEDAALSSSRFFQATTYPLMLLLEATQPGIGATTEVRLHTPGSGPIDFRLAQRDLPHLPDDPASPWLLAPPGVRAILRRVITASRPLGSRPDRRPCRGIFTSANEVFIGRWLGGNADTIRLRFRDREVELESECVRPVLRGSGLEPWAFHIEEGLIWTHDGSGAVRTSLPGRTRAYLDEHRDRLRARSELRSRRPFWTLFRVAPEKWNRRVAWRDIGRNPAAVVIPPTIQRHGMTFPVISLNTVYQVATDGEDEAHTLACLLNSLVVRVFLRSIAERANGGYFRFLGWTVGALPIPAELDPEVRRALVSISHEAHRHRGLGHEGGATLDRLVARIYGLSSEDLEVLERFDARLETV